MTRTLRLLAVLLALGFGLAACGDDGDDGGDDVAATESETPADPDDEGSDDAGSDYGGGGGETEDEGGGGDAGGTAVAIADIAFDPGSLEVAVGDTVTWTNDDPVPHTVTADDGAFDSGNVDQGGTFDQTFDEAGEFAYHCEIHPGMEATITVS